jgi:hypothetical protein
MARPINVGFAVPAVEHGASVVPAEHMNNYLRSARTKPTGGFASYLRGSARIQIPGRDPTARIR